MIPCSIRTDRTHPMMPLASPRSLPISRCSARFEWVVSGGLLRVRLSLYVKLMPSRFDAVSQLAPIGILVTIDRNSLGVRQLHLSMLRQATKRDGRRHEHSSIFTYYNKLSHDFNTKMSSACLLVSPQSRVVFDEQDLDLSDHALQVDHDHPIGSRL